ncbi:hypothetical protein BJ742DRAFT_769090 [Cladochytrium replicatum]|nr:hypothetical protein BJ742DRAFT_769090 [Cladochytrium replicatum]
MRANDSQLILPTAMAPTITTTLIVSEFSNATITPTPMATSVPAASSLVSTLNKHWIALVVACCSGFIFFCVYCFAIRDQHVDDRVSVAPTPQAKREDTLPMYRPPTLVIDHDPEVNGEGASVSMPPNYTPPLIAARPL